MTLTQRRWLLIFFTIFFLVFSPILILYASGYRYNTRLHKIEQVGLLSVSTLQKDTKATIDGVSYTIKRDGLELPLPPRDHDIVISKDGYHPWEKTLSVVEGKTAFARSIRLFADTQPEPIELFTNPLQHFAESDRLVLYGTPKTFVVFAKQTRQILETDLPQPDIAVEDLSYRDGMTFAFRQGQIWYRGEITSKAIDIVALVLPEQTKRVVVGDQVLFALTSDRVWEWNKGTLTPLVTLPEVVDIVKADRHFWIISAEATHKHCFLYELVDATASSTFITSLPYANTWMITDVSGTLITVADQAQQQLRFIDTRISPPAEAPIEGVFDWHWSKDHRSLLTATQNEISIYHIDNGVSQELIARQSDAISGAIWGPDETWILYTTAASVVAVERDDRDVRNVISLAENKGQPKLIGLSTDRILFSSQEKQSFVIWDLAIDTL